MSGWDEGNVFYSDQGYVNGEDNDVQIRHIARRKFIEFVKNFQKHAEQGKESYEDVNVYRDQLLKNKNRLEIDLEDLRNFDEKLGALLVEKPAEYLPLLEGAAADVLASLKNKTVDDNNEAESVDVQVMLTSKDFFGPATIRQMTSEYISKLVMVRGIIISAAKTRAKATNITVQCRTCKNVKRIPCKPGFGGAPLPRTCDLTQIAEQSCGLDPYDVLPDRSKYVDQQTLKLQELPEDVPTGEMPRHMVLSVDRHLVQRIVPGTRVKVVGIYSIYSGQGGKKSETRNTVALKQSYIRVVGMEQNNLGARQGNLHVSPADEQEFKDFASRPDVIQQIRNMVAPSIFGHADVKAAVACLLFGGSRKHLPDGVRLRGDINVLALGDPSTAKSQFLKFVEKTAPIAFYTSGKGSSAAGLTASVIRDASTGEFCLEGGAMVLADGGVVCIDEFDKMRPEDRVAIHEAMEQQTISIAKAGITTVFNSRCSVLAAANPPSGRYDDMKSAQENIDLQTTILSRFDLIFIVKDERSRERDIQIAKYVIDIHMSYNGRPAADDANPAQEENSQENFLKRFVDYCRSRCSPRLTESTATLLQNEYVTIRENSRRSLREANGGPPPVPITVRQLEALVRLSESLAKMQLQETVSEVHVREAIRLFKESTLAAAQSGLTHGVVIRPEDREEVEQITQFFQRRVPIGSAISTRQLVDEMSKHGFNNTLSWRSLKDMEHKGEVEMKREGRQIVRKK